jgi:hypothetical protein
MLRLFPVPVAAGQFFTVWKQDKVQEEYLVSSFLCASRRKRLLRYLTQTLYLLSAGEPLRKNSGEEFVSELRAYKKGFCYFGFFITLK